MVTDEEALEEPPVDEELPVDEAPLVDAPAEEVPSEEPMVEETPEPVEESTEVVDDPILDDTPLSPPE